MTLFETAASGDLAALKRGICCEWQDFRARDRQGNTLLHYVVPSCGLDAVKYLTDYLNMDPLDANLRGVTPYDLALERGDRELLAWFEEKTGIAPQALVHNPVRRGFYPDPSWIRVGQDYYMVNSSFCFFPCLPISKSRDLVHWTTVGYALTNPEWARVYRSEDCGVISPHHIGVADHTFRLLRPHGQHGDGSAQLLPDAQGAFQSKQVEGIGAGGGSQTLEVAGFLVDLHRGARGNLLHAHDHFHGIIPFMHLNALLLHFKA